jgi:hypothetical protein
MATKAINFKFTGTTTPISSYDETKINLGSLIKKYTGPFPKDKFIGPAKIGLARPMEQSTSIVGGFIHAISFSENIDWVFLSDNSSGASTRRIILYEYNKETSIFNWKGFITLTYPTATNHLIRGFKVSRELYTNGTVAVSGTTVTGTGTSWLSHRMSVGCRIGFGATDPSLISTWYEISSISGESTITLTSNAGTISPGTPYVIEDIIIITANTNGTLTNGGLYIAKGIRPELFTPSGTTIPAATTVDNIRAVYWLADAPTVTNTGACGAALGTRTSWTNQLVYVLNSAGPRVYVYNFRAPLTLTAGRDTTTNTIKTGDQSVVGTISQTNNGVIGTLSHGPGSGIPSLYFVTTNRVYRCELSSITNNSINWQTDVMVEIPPGGTNTYTTSSLLSSCEISSNIDRLVISTSGANGSRSYITRYNTISEPFDHTFLVDDKQLDNSSADSRSVPHPSISLSPFSFSINEGILYICRLTVSSLSNQLYTLPLEADYNYAIQNNQLLITPKLDISDSNKLYNIYVNNIPKLGEDEFSLSTESYRVYYRTNGISDNTGTWNLLDCSGDLTGVYGTEIQFAFTFKTIGTTCIPARLLGFSLIYEDNSTDGHYQPSVAKSNISTNIFAYRQSVLWNSNIPNMRIRMYNASTGNLILDDDTISSNYGTWQYSSDNGVSWNAWDNTQDVVGNYIRYTANSLPGGVRIKALLTQA